MRFLIEFDLHEFLGQTVNLLVPKCLLLPAVRDACQSMLRSKARADVATT